jgi:hypothetical protein
VLAGKLLEAPRALLEIKAPSIISVPAAVIVTSPAGLALRVPVPMLPALLSEMLPAVTVTVPVPPALPRFDALRTLTNGSSFGKSVQVGRQNRASIDQQ